MVRVPTCSFLAFALQHQVAPCKPAACIKPSIDTTVQGRRPSLTKRVQIYRISYKCWNKATHAISRLALYQHAVLYRGNLLQYITALYCRMVHGAVYSIMSGTCTCARDAQKNDRVLLGGRSISETLTLIPFLAHIWDRGVPTTADTVLPVWVNSTTTFACGQHE